MAIDSRSSSAVDKKDTDYSLDKATFDERHIEMLKKRTGIKLPKGTKGLNLFSKSNTIDPEIFAKLEIPKASVDNIVTQLAGFNRAMGIMDDTNDALDWWTPPKTMRMDNNYFHDGALINVIFCRENKRWILYIECLSGT